MSNGFGVNPHVEKIYQRDDNTVAIHVRTDSFKAGQEVEVSGYLIQGSGAYAAFNVKKHIPFDTTEPAVLYVELPAMDLNADDDVTVVTRIAEVWPTILKQEVSTSAEYLGAGIKSAWTAQYPSGKEPGAAIQRSEAAKEMSELASLTKRMSATESYLREQIA